MDGKTTLKSYLLQFREGILDKNPILIQLLGTCPTLATTTSVSNAIGMGISTTVVLIFSNMFISLLRKFIPKEVRIATYIVIISGFVSAVELFIKAYIPALDKSLGVFIPLIVVNCIILARAEAFASKNKLLPSIVDGFTMGLGFLIALIMISSIREIIGNGSWLGIDLFGSLYQPAIIFIMPSGAFLTLGCMMAIVKRLAAAIKNHEVKTEPDLITVSAKETIEPAAENNNEKADPAIGIIEAADSGAVNISLPEPSGETDMKTEESNEENNAGSEQTKIETEINLENIANNSEAGENTDVN